MLKITFVEHGVTPPDGGWDTRQDPESTPSLGKKNGVLFGESTWKSKIDMVNCQSNGISLIILADVLSLTLSPTRMQTSMWSWCLI